MSIFDLIFPVQCPGCGQWDTPACDACLEPIAHLTDVSARLPQLSRVAADGSESPLIPVWAMSSYEETANLIRAWKSSPSNDLDRLIGEQVERAARRLPKAMEDLLDGVAEVDVVPAPSRAARYRADTYIAGTLADSVARGFARDIDRPFTVTSRTMFRPRAGRQRGRSRRDRRLREPVRLIGDTPPRAVILVDDVATTGATLESCWRALAVHHRVLGAVCAAAVIPPAEFIDDAADDEGRGVK